MDINNRYTKMQREFYENEASLWNTNNKDPVVGFFDQHNNWDDYSNFLFKNIKTNESICLDFGCGPGRNIVKFNDIFKRIDGCDISSKNLENAKIWIKYNDKKECNLYLTNGINLDTIPNDSYDIVFSTICLQHICVYEIRYNLMCEFYRVLKTNGALSCQMGFDNNKNSDYANYYYNEYGALGTNGARDVSVENPNQLKLDLEKIGFKNFEFDIRPVGPGDGHDKWIFFRAFK